MLAISKPEYGPCQKQPKHFDWDILLILLVDAEQLRCQVQLVEEGHCPMHASM